MMKIMLGTLRSVIRRSLHESASSVMDMTRRSMEEQAYFVVTLLKKHGVDPYEDGTDFERFRAVEDEASKAVVRDFDAAFGTRYVDVDLEELQALEGGTSADGLAATFHALWHESLRPGVWRHFFSVGATDSLEDELNEDLVRWLSQDQYEAGGPIDLHDVNNLSQTAKRMAERLLARMPIRDPSGAGWILDDGAAEQRFIRGQEHIKQDLVGFTDPRRAEVVRSMLSYAKHAFERSSGGLDENELAYRLSRVLWKRIESWGSDIIDAEVASRLRRWLRTTGITLKRMGQKIESDVAAGLYRQEID